MMRALIILVTFLSSQITFAQWNPNAGIVQPVTTHAIIEVSSGTRTDAIMDGNLHTYWESTNPLPSNYILRNDLNIFLDKTKFNLKSSSHNSSNAFDGNTSSKTLIENRQIEIKFEEPEQVLLLSIKINTEDTVWITINQDQLFSYLPSENYSLKEIKFINTKNLSSI